MRVPVLSNVRRRDPPVHPALTLLILLSLSAPRGVGQRISHEEEEVVLQHGQLEVGLVIGMVYVVGSAGGVVPHAAGAGHARFQW